MIKDLINSPIDYAYFIIQKDAVEVMIDLTAEVSTIKTVAAKGLVLGAIDINRNDIHMKKALIKQNIMVILQVAMVNFEIQYLEIVSVIQPITRASLLYWV